MTGYDDVWKQKKEDILNGIDKLMEEESVDKDVLDVMKEMVERTKVIPSIGDYMDEQLEED
jgi:tRNA(Phe) wybutosine-synthesizing methylase Tyw3